MAALWEQVARDWMVDEEGGDGFVVFTLSRLPSCGFQANLPFPSAVLLCVFCSFPRGKLFLSTPFHIPGAGVGLRVVTSCCLAAL